VVTTPMDQEALPTGLGRDSDCDIAATTGVDLVMSAGHVLRDTTPAT